MIDVGELREASSRPGCPGFVPARDRGVDGELALAREGEPARRAERALGIARAPSCERRPRSRCRSARATRSWSMRSGLRIEARPPHPEQHELRIATVERRGLERLGDERRRSGPGSAAGAELRDPPQRILAAQDLVTRSRLLPDAGRGRSGSGQPLRRSRTRPIPAAASATAAAAIEEINVFDMAAYSGDDAPHGKRAGPAERSCPIWENAFHARGAPGAELSKSLEESKHLIC